MVAAFGGSEYQFWMRTWISTLWLGWVSVAMTDGSMRVGPKSHWAKRLFRSRCWDKDAPCRGLQAVPAMWADRLSLFIWQKYSRFTLTLLLQPDSLHFFYCHHWIFIHLIKNICYYYWFFEHLTIHLIQNIHLNM
jgi:hypothetical protein